MKPEDAAAELGRLREAAGNGQAFVRDHHAHTTWKSQVRAVIRRSLGSDHELLQESEAVKYGLMVWTDSTPESEWDAAFLGGVRTDMALAEAAIYELGLASRSLEAEIAPDNFDPDLRAHV